MQVREVLRILQQHPQRPKDLEDKVIHWHDKDYESVGMAKGRKLWKLPSISWNLGKLGKR